MVDYSESILFRQRTPCHTFLLIHTPMVIQGEVQVQMPRWTERTPADFFAAKSVVILTRATVICAMNPPTGWNGREKVIMDVQCSGRKREEGG